MHLKILHLYARRMNLYGDRGNIVTLVRRCKWRDIAVSVDQHDVGESVQLPDYDLFFFGGGQDAEQRRVGVDLQRHQTALLETIEAGAALLSVCGGYQLLGNEYRPHNEDPIAGIGLFDAVTTAGPKRMIGNVVVESSLELESNQPLIGFENHSGETRLGDGATPLGQVRHGHGNNGEDGTEGCVRDGAIGTYLHGSLLPKNPHLADWLLQHAMRRRYPHTTLSALDDSLELLANDKMTRRLG